jgi:hypothetical protein
MVANANHLPDFILFDDGEMDVTPLTLGRFCLIWYQMRGKTMLFPMISARCKTPTQQPTRREMASTMRRQLHSTTEEKKKSPSKNSLGQSVTAPLHWVIRQNLRIVNLRIAETKTKKSTKDSQIRKFTIHKLQIWDTRIQIALRC